MQISAAVLIPPPHVQRRIASLQEEIFRRFGSASAMALPVMLPLCWLPGAITPSDLSDALAGLTWTSTLLDHGPRRVGPDLFLAFDTEDGERGVLSTLDKRLGGLASGSEGLFPCEGVFLCSDDNTESLESVVASLSLDPPLSFSRFTCSLARIEAADPPRAWWEAVYWELVGEIKFRFPV